MTLGILVLASKQPEVLERHVDLWSKSDGRFYVHVDSKVDIKLFSRVASHQNVNFIEDRQSIFWGGFNMIRAEIALLRAALLNFHITHFALISDDTFSLMRPEVLYSRLGGGALWIDQFDCTNQPRVARYRDFYYFDSDATNPQYRDTEKRFFNDNDMLKIADLAELRRQGKTPLHAYVCGSQWWCLPRDAAEVVVEKFDTDIYLRKSFEFSAIPDEAYIQTIVSAEKQRNWKFKPSPIWVDFSKNPKPYIFGQPDELEKPLASERLFIRKLEAGSAALQALTTRLSA